MANIKSAKKRIKTIKRQRTENKLVKSALSTEIKKYKKMLLANDVTNAEVQLKKVVSMLDSACAKGVFHKNNVARKQSRLTLALNKVRKNEELLKAEAKVAEAEIKEDKKVEAEAVEKVEETKAATKKTTAKKTTTTAKTTTTKKATAAKKADTK